MFEEDVGCAKQGQIYRDVFSIIERILISELV